ncbi:hypothetical protein T4B_6763 [Trichinella pseudospiralis]|uniref:Uncharacterized protein n=1 Tax=Trichinella pseudospiralis TaxID=6337 RepID=A0A0V0XXF7_TRIPS|nr:hypothetical protein T4E_3564 [Trichinella pseudospiralis]KRZ08437.1 hypothetical protein T4B_6763 [Trichinella pseudospiralis]
MPAVEQVELPLSRRRPVGYILLVWAEMENIFWNRDRSEEEATFDNITGKEACQTVQLYMRHILYLF